MVLLKVNLFLKALIILEMFVSLSKMCKLFFNYLLSSDWVEIWHSYVSSVAMQCSGAIELVWWCRWKDFIGTSKLHLFGLIWFILTKTITLCGSLGQMVKLVGGHSISQTTHDKLIAMIEQWFPGSVDRVGRWRWALDNKAMHFLQV